MFNTLTISKYWLDYRLLVAFLEIRTIRCWYIKISCERLIRKCLGEGLFSEAALQRCSYKKEC